MSTIHLLTKEVEKPCIEETLGLASELMIQQNYLGTLDTEPKVEKGCLDR